MENLGPWIPLLLELGVIIIGGVLFFVRQDHMLNTIKEEVESLKKENHKDADDIHLKLNDTRLDLNTIKTHVETLVRKANGK